MSWTDRVAAPAYFVVRIVLGAAARVYFRSIEVRHGERVPVRGALLVVANHPASFTDVIVVATALSRRLHFLAMAPIFKPWIRGLGLRLCGALPVYRRQDDPAQMDKNEDTLHALVFFQWLAHQNQRIRLVLFKASDRRRIARLRRERRELIELFEQSRRDYEATRRPTSTAT